jgi:exoribonuclease R
MPEQEIVIDGDSWRLEFRGLQEVENWNAQISLLTGIAAASIMLEHKVGILRTLPPAEKRSVDRLRRTAKALRIDWPADQDYPAFVRSLDPSKPSHQAMVVACTSLLRGAGYAAFDGELPQVTEHAALATTYAHVTAPLRRLVDRYAEEICVALCAGDPVPQWVLDAMTDLPATMQDAGRRAATYEHAITDLVEAELLKGSVGDRFTGVVLEVDHDDPRKGKLQIAEPAVEATVRGEDALPVGDEVEAALSVADPATRTVEFTH